MSASPGKKGFSTESLAASAFYETALRSGGRGDGKTQPRSPRPMPAQLPRVCFSEGAADRQQHK